MCIGREVREEQASIRTFMERYMGIFYFKITSKSCKLSTDTEFRTRMGVMILEEREYNPE